MKDALCAWQVLLSLSWSEPATSAIPFPASPASARRSSSSTTGVLLRAASTAPADELRGDHLIVRQRFELAEELVRARVRVTFRRTGSRMARTVCRSVMKEMISIAAPQRGQTSVGRT
jgi:hypothetical protein